MDIHGESSSDSSMDLGKDFLNENNVVGEDSLDEEEIIENSN